MAPSTPKKPTKGATNSSEPLHSAASKDIWLASLGAMAQAQAAAQEQMHEAAAHFNQMTQGLSAGLVQPMPSRSIGLNICLKTAWHVPSKVWDCPQPRKWLICKSVWLLWKRPRVKKWRQQRRRRHLENGLRPKATRPRSLR